MSESVSVSVSVSLSLSLSLCVCVCARARFSLFLSLRKKVMRRCLHSKTGRCPLLIFFFQVLQGLGSDVTLYTRKDGALRSFDSLVHTTVNAALEKQGVACTVYRVACGV